MKKYLFLSIVYLMFVTLSADYFPVPKKDFIPAYYACYMTNEPLLIDGKMDEVSWQKAEWTQPFVDIEGDLKPKPFYKTQVKMLYDKDYFYFFAYMEDKDLWATLTERDAVIFHDNDFEIFIDPDGDTHDYYELELNAFNTIWDLLVIKPYRDRNQVAVNAWDIKGLKSAVYLDGSINDNRDQDKGWSVEIAIPWKVLEECAHRSAPPKDKDIWKVNFSRVHYDLDKEGSSYKKRVNPETGQKLPEYNWVWSPQGLIAMHYPELWGNVQFFEKSVPEWAIESGHNTKLNEMPIKDTHNPSYIQTQKDLDKKLLRYIYYSQKQYYMNHQEYADDLKELAFSYPYDAKNYKIEFFTSPHTYEIILNNLKTKDKLYLFHDSRLLEKIDF
ncbi:MAG TPA: carbohydrate-binding family 9-like protein [Candidatus Cloacimonadota bacterium]|nr:carbohydrate-binding family 9-like protein [Candidatus Cloacimonadota bacterium]